MKKNNLFKLLFVLMVSQVFCAFSVWAGESVTDAMDALTFQGARADLAQKHGLTIKPYLKTGSSYLSNVFKASEIPEAGKHGAMVWNITPGFDAVHTGDYGRAGISYEADFEYVTRFEEANTQDQDFLAFVNLLPTDNTYFNLSNRLTQEGGTPGSPAFENVNYLDNRVETNMGVNLESGQTLEFGYQNYNHDFQETVASRYSYNENIFDWRVYQATAPRQRIYTGFRLGDVDFGHLHSRDTTYYEFPVGLEGDLFWGWKSNASVGLHHRNLQASDRNDVTTVVTNVGVQKTFYKLKSLRASAGDHQLMPTTLDLGFLRRPVEGTFSTATTFDEKLFYGSLKHLVTKRMRGRMSVYAGNSDYDDRVYTGTRVLVGGALFVTTPDQVRRTDDIFGCGLGTDYDVSKYLKLHFDYNYSRRASNVNGLDYSDHTVSVRTTIPL